MDAGTGATSDTTDDPVVLVPLKSFRSAKGRLADDLDEGGRVRLAQTMAERVFAAAAPLRVCVVCDDTDVAEWAGDRGARVIWVDADGLDAAVTGAVAVLAADGVERVVIAHGDLPLATGLADLGGEPHGVTLVPDRHRDGTNVLVVPTGAGFRFAYGPGSFERHWAEAARLGLPARVVGHATLGIDVDDADDLAAAVEADPTLLTALARAAAAPTPPAA